MNTYICATSYFESQKANTSQYFFYVRLGCAAQAVFFSPIEANNWFAWEHGGLLMSPAVNITNIANIS